MSMTDIEDGDEHLDDEPQEVEEEALAVSVEDRARAMGWRPQPADARNPQPHEYRGDPRRWTDAETFIEIGERDLPVLRDQNRRMSDRLVRQDREMETLQRTVAEQADAVKTAIELAQRADDRGYERARNDIKAKQRQAVTDGDEVTYDQVTAELDALETARAATTAAPPPPKPADDPPAAPRLHVAVRQFISDNPWFEDARRPYLREAAIGFEKAEAARDPDAPMEERMSVVRDKMRTAYPEIEEDAMPRQRQDRDPFRRRAAPSQEPTAGAPPRRRPGASPIDAIADPEERKGARAAYESIKRGLGGEYTEAEYMAVYEDPHADVLDVMKQHRKT